MKVKLSKLLLLTAVFSPAFAETYKLEEMVTTATREKEKITDIPVRVDSVPKDELKLDRPNHIKEDLNSLPGVLITQVAASLGHATAIRLPINYGPYYLYLQDGIPVQSSGFFNHNALWWTSWESSLGGLEVLKGVGTALYGSDAIGAVINVKSEEPTGEKKIEVEGGQWGYFRVKGGVSDIPSEENAYLANFSYSQADGWRRKTRFKRGEVLLKHYHYFDADTSLETSFLANKMDAQMAGYLDYETFKTDPSSSGLPADLTDPYRKVDMARLSFKYENNIDTSSKLKLIPYVRFNRNQYVATWIPQVYPERDTKTYTLGALNQYILKSSFGKTIFGFDVEFTKANSHYWQSRPTVIIWGNEYPQGDIYKYDVDFINLAPYVHHQLAVNKVRFTLGLRVDYARYEYDNKLSDGEFGVWYRPADRSDEFKHISPKAGLVYLINKDNSVFFRYAHGFRIPQASKLYELKSDYKEVSLDPEKADSFEIGYTGRFKRFMLSASGYYMEIKDKIVTVDTGAIRYNTNAGKTRHKGVELGATVFLPKGFKVRGSYSYSLHKYVDFNTGDADYSGNDMSMAPRTLSNVRVIYSPTKKYAVELEYQHVGWYYMDDANTKKYGGYDIYNFRAETSLTKNLKIFAKVWNITDKRYAETANIAYGKERYRPGMPRTYYFGLSLIW